MIGGNGPREVELCEEEPSAPNKTLIIMIVMMMVMMMMMMMFMMMMHKNGNDDCGDDHESENEDNLHNKFDDNDGDDANIIIYLTNVTDNGLTLPITHNNLLILS